VTTQRSDGRPDPDALLARAEAEEAERGHGRLRVFFGAAPGVGKTYAMLEAARVRRREGIDVVSGWIETHGRAETEALTEGLERLPPREVDYRGVRLREFDLEAAIARRPGLLLVDELAHTNSPGSKHAKRWQDVEEVLEAGIDVYTTLNVQHLESLNDVVAQITTVAVRETVPDSVFEKAHEVELVDLTPDDLLQRLREGKVYVPAEAERAIDRFFRKGNLIALREMALQRTAERVDAQMARWKQEQGIAQPWPTRERILVALGPAPQSADLVRAAYRMAARLHAPWIALSVETPAFHRLPVRDREMVAAHLTLAERLGAEAAVMAAEDVSQAVLDLARQRNVTRILVGKPTHPRWRDRIQGSLVERLVRGSGPIDVLVTTGEPEETPAAARAAPTPPTPLREYLWAGAVVLASTALCASVRPLLEMVDEAMLYLLGVLFVASRFSRGPAIVASLLSVAAFDFFFVPPFLTFTVTDTRYLLTFGVMLATGLVVSSLTVRIRQQAEAARDRERRTATLYAMTRSFAFWRGVSEIAEAAARHVELLFEIDAVVLIPDADGGLVVRGGSGEKVAASERELSVARWVLAHGRAAGYGTDTLPGTEALFLPLAGGKAPVGVLGVAVGRRGAPLTPSQTQLLDVFASHTALALERALLTEEAERAHLTVETERLRNALLSAISHDLRTPVAAVMGSVTSLLDEGAGLDEESRRDLLETIRDEADRLSRLLADVLDLTRIESGALTARKEWFPLEEVVGASLARLEERLEGRETKVDLPGPLLLVPLDAVLVEQVFVNLIENAIKYTPPGSPIEIGAEVAGDVLTVEVADRGAGIPAGDEEKIFEKFYRVLGAGDAGGTGLGLAVCRAIVKAHGGRIWAENRAGGGAVFRFTLPVEGVPPAIEDTPAAAGEAAT